MPAKPLKWRKPQDTGQDYGREGAAWVADGIGGTYAIEADGLLWWADDPFTFVQCANVAAAKATAEEDWQKRFAALEAPATPSHPEGREGA